MIERLVVPTGGRVLDIGCGKGEFLLRIISRFNALGAGIDVSPHFLGDARQRANDRGLQSKVAWHHADASTVPFPPASVDVAVCIGATEVFGGMDGTLSRLSPSVAPGGYLVVGDLFWRELPDAEAAAAFGIEADRLTDLSGTVAMGGKFGLTPFFASVSTEEEWDEYEWDYVASVETYAGNNPTDTDATAFVSRAHLMRDTYLEWRRRAMGFVIVLYRRETV